jgi:flavorubredoxin
MHDISDMIRFCETELVAPDTHVIRQITGERTNPVAIYVNSMVITGAEPIIVDCGPAITRAGWLDHAFELVDPIDVRWIYLSHDDVDHTGNLLQVLDACPNATIVTNWFSVERMNSDYLLPLDRMRWVNPGESFFAGDRELVAVVPPTFDSPTTRGLFDTSTGVYWAADSFAMPVTHHVDDIGDLDPGFVVGSVPMINAILSPWHQWLDPVKYNRHIDAIAALGASVVASAHGVALRGPQVTHVLDLLRGLPDLDVAPLPGQADLELIVKSLTAVPEDAA